MAFILDKLEDMRNIYEASKKVYTHEISIDNAVSDLMKKTEAKTSSLKMYFNIYAHMRKGTCYKMGTSAGFTKFLLEHIFSDFGEDALLTALRATKLHAEYRVSVNNEQPGIEKVCREIIMEKHIALDYDSLPSYHNEENGIILSEEDKNRLLYAIQKNNSEFSEIIMTLIEQYQILSDSDIALLCDKQKSRELFASDYAYFKEVDVSSELSPQLKSSDGRNRYYGITYVLNKKTYVMTSQLYGLGTGSSHRNNRNPFHELILSKFGISTKAYAWFPSLSEYNPGFTKEQWLEILNNPEIIGPVWGGVLAMFYTEKAGATCSMIGKKFNKSAASINASCTQLAKSIHLLTGCPVMRREDEDKYRYWTILFQGRNTKNDEPGTWVWRLRSELYEALTEFGIEKYLSDVVQTGKFDSWEIIDETTAIKRCDKSFFDHNGSGVPKGICWFFDAEELNSGESKQIKLIYNEEEYIARVVNDTTDRRRVQILWRTDLGNKLGAYKNSSTLAIFKKISEDTFEVVMETANKEGEEMTTKEKIEAIKNYITAKGFNYEGNLIENFYLSLKSKPFVILAGTSGTGKTRLVKLFAEAIGAKMKLVPVRPDWSDSSDLFGHTNLSSKFQPGAIIDFVKQAEWDKETPYFLCLDEMNLARVEYYLSDFLSIIETRDRKDNGDIETDPMVDVDYYKDKDAAAKYGRVFIPDNLYIIGTVNMDETTFPFSKKVLDRANTIEFSYVNLMSKPAAETPVMPSPLNEDNSFLKTEYLYLRDCDDLDVVDSVCFDLEDLNSILVKANLHVGYRVRDEISFYMMNNKNTDLLSKEAAFDNEIMQKILPRIQGSSRAIKDVLSELFKKFAGEYTDLAGATDFEKMQSYIDAAKNCKYPNSAKKIAFMMRRYEEDGFTSYWL